EAYNITKRKRLACRKILLKRNWLCLHFTPTNKKSFDAFGMVPERQQTSHKMLRSAFFAQAGTMLTPDPSASPAQRCIIFTKRTT
ncbi:MAG: hypothetical protein ACXV2B_05015, partial [Halobacteriota archaeon]